MNIRSNVLFQTKTKNNLFSKDIAFVVNVVVCFSDENSFRSTYTRLYV